MKILIVGEWAWTIYEEAFAQGLRENGVEVAKLSYKEMYRGLSGKFQKAIPSLLPTTVSFNRLVLHKVEVEKPDVVLFWRPINIFPRTIKKLNEFGVITISYNNDDPFGPEKHGNVPLQHHFLWRYYKKCLPFFKYNFFYRRINCDEAKAYGAKHAEVMLPYFLPWRDKPVELSIEELERFETDIVFVGHYEPDGREKAILALLDAGIRVKIWGGHYWSRKVIGKAYDRLAPIVSAEGDEYAKALCGAKICLAFLSKLNRDSYTRRCFEIPACGRLMLAERTADLVRFFKEDEEACFFSSHVELVIKARWLLNNTEIREKIARAGLQRVWKDGHDVTSRAKQFLSILQS